MKYHVILYDRDTDPPWDILDVRMLDARNLQGAKKEAEKIRDECGLRDITVVLYNKNNNQIARYPAYNITFI